jgi:orotate phosphoribosyltransferase
VITETKKELALKLFDIGAIKFGAFRLKLHEKKPDAQLINGLKFDVLADGPTAATPIVAILSYKMKIPMISPRKEEKKHGIKRPIDGMFKEGQVVLLVDDLITLADSKLEAISVLEENNMAVNDVIVLLDREQGGVGELERKGYTCHTVFRLKELLKLYLDFEKISYDQYKQTVSYLESS